MGTTHEEPLQAPTKYRLTIDSIKYAYHLTGVGSSLLAFLADNGQQGYSCDRSLVVDVLC